MPMEIVPPGTNIDFIGKWRICVGISVAVILISLAAIPIRGFRLGIDFAGGVELQTKFAAGVAADEGAIRRVVGETGVPEPSVVRFGEAEQNSYLVRFRSESAGDRGELVDQIRDALVAGTSKWRSSASSSSARESVPNCRRRALGALLHVASVLSSRSLQSALCAGAVVALVHDIVITSGVFVLIGASSI